jgi:hypothetical protein
MARKGKQSAIHMKGKSPRYVNKPKYVRKNVNANYRSIGRCEETFRPQYDNGLESIL